MNVVPEGMVIEDGEDRLRHSVVRILDRGYREVGTGFFVQGDLVVTCAHVVREALEQGQVLHIEGGEEVTIRPFPGSPEGQDLLVATVEGQHFRDKDAEDVAFLRLRPPLPGIQPLALATSQGMKGDN